MKSYYGNLVADFFELLFAIVSLFLVWVSCLKDSMLFFGITAVVYMLPRFLSIILGIFNNGKDKLRLIFDLISIIALFLSFLIVCCLMINCVKEIIPKGLSIIIRIFFIISSISLFDIVFKLVDGIVQKVYIMKQTDTIKIN